MTQAQLRLIDHHGKTLHYVIEHVEEDYAGILITEWLKDAIEWKAALEITNLKAKRLSYGEAT